MTKKHLQFCIYYMQTGDQQVAYKMAYPRAAVKSLKASASRLMARPDVAEWVNGTEERVHNRMMRQFHSEHYDEFKEKLLTINEKRTVLTKIIKGETKRVRYVKVKYGVQKVEEDLSADTVLRAIDLDTRLENFYNYLTRSDTWRKTQNIYVNTPTLQQQVNILISKAGENAENVDTVESIQINSPTKSPPVRTAQPGGLQGDRGTPTQATPEPITPPPGRGVCEPCAQAGWVHSRGAGNTSPLQGDLGVHSRLEIPPLKEVPCEHRAEDVYSRSTGYKTSSNTNPHSEASITTRVGVHSRRTPAPDTHKQITSPPGRACSAEAGGVSKPGAEGGGSTRTIHTTNKKHPDTCLQNQPVYYKRKTTTSLQPSLRAR